MPSRRERSSRITEDEINGLILKLQTLMLPASTNTRASTSNVLKETCNYLKKLQKDVDDLSERLSQLLASETVDADMVRTLLQH